jgi:hypothetical protein
MLVTLVLCLRDVFGAVSGNLSVTGTRDETRRNGETYCKFVSMLLPTTDSHRTSYLMATIAVLAWLTPVAPGTGG